MMRLLINILREATAQDGRFDLADGKQKLKI